MAEKDATARLRRAVKENNLFLVKRLVQRTDMRNPDPNFRRFTSLSWAAVLGHGETFEFLLNEGHDDEELSRDTENNTIFMLLADQKLHGPGQYASRSDEVDNTAAVLRMARMYYDRYSGALPDFLDWPNVHGKTALHIAALKGNEELVRMLCDLGADFNLADDQGNTPLHYASTWGHIPIVQLLIERGCHYTARNNEGFSASDYAYSFSTRDTLQDAVRLQYENNKKSRREQAAQANTRGGEWGPGDNTPRLPPSIPSKAGIDPSPSRMRSGSGTSRSTTTSDSGDADAHYFLHSRNHQPSASTSSTPSAPSGSHIQQSSNHSSQASFPNYYGHTNSNSQSTLSMSQNAGRPADVAPIVSRMRERDADAIEKYMRRNRSGSSSTDAKSQNGSTTFSSAGPSANGDDIMSLNSVSKSGGTTPRRLRPSISAAQLRTTPEEDLAGAPVEVRTRAGTNPSTTSRPAILHPRSSSSISPRIDKNRLSEEPENYIGPSSQYATFPPPPEGLEQDTSTPTVNSRRIGFHLLSKRSFDLTGGQERAGHHRRGSSSTSVR